MLEYPESLVKDFQPKITVLDYANILVDPKNPLESQPDPFIKRFNGKMYYDPWQNIDMRMNPLMPKNRTVERAVWAYAASSQTVPTILPTFLSPEYMYAVPTDAPAYAAIPRKASLGAQENYVRITSLGAPTYWVAQDANVAYVAPTPERLNQKKAIAETWGGATGFHRAAGEGFKNVLEEAIRERITGLLTNGLEDGILNGDDGTNNAKGFITWQGQTNIVCMGSAAVTLDKIEESLRAAWNAGGNLENYGFAITDPATYDYVRKLVMEDTGYVNPDNYNLPWGVKTYSVNGMPFIKSRKMPTTTNEKRILELDRRVVYLAVLTDMTTELYGKTKDATEFAVKWYGNAINQCPEFCAQVAEIA